MNDDPMNDAAADDTPIDAVPAPAPAPAPQEGPTPAPGVRAPRRRGRPVGAVDRVPRVRRRDRPRKPAPAVGEAFGGRLADDRAAAPPPAPGQVPDLAGVMAIPADQLAPVILGLMSTIVVTAGAMRYGPEIGATLAFDADDRRAIEPPLSAYLADAMPRVTPGEMLALTLCVVLGGKIVRAEQAHDKAKNKAPARPRPPSPPAAGSADAAAGPPALSVV